MVWSKEDWELTLRMMKWSARIGEARRRKIEWVDLRRRREEVDH
jgi:hypothetical protein